eukprot:m.121359 g.121359  ORF g.121359 m.121359 type:complete len:53 (+) comp9376_c2_seq1:141-299(+)
MIIYCKEKTHHCSICCSVQVMNVLVMDGRHEDLMCDPGNIGGENIITARNAQ